VIMRVAVAVAVIVRVLVIVRVVVTVLFPVAVLAHGVPRPAHAPCPGAVPSACSAWWIASITSWRA